ncbi:hypothetical protein ILUMI_19831 [Ignelater luminosus]|uniref:Mutator-like transposase domain-containing protein n=1 Tax=Ignelater luminosus TaxID=2038154 RepID=A0A8K0CLP5_IGNLU|nr:hypothetical protein ILUMI_19831 [Ignelater luminosus]
MSAAFYRKVEEKIGKVWISQLHSQMLKAAEEEQKIAISKNHIENRIPYITVIADGECAKRSYGHSYSSLSGAGCIIGEKTEKEEEEEILVCIHEFCSM